ncbi:MAG TPA: arsenate reductase ArsC [Candidatus Polarisedimenticolia bacterium]|nr:arsenate reductase ArsC [Candidatus Polarisedimenticolia bacterium]
MKPKQRPFTVLFVCTGNAARSQMAEGLAGHLGKGRIEAHSAGTRPAGMVMAAARAVMKERGIELVRHFSKGLDAVPGPFDLVITLCDSAVQECPAALVDGAHEHWSTPDPTFTEGGPDEVLEAFRQVRDRLEAQITALIQRVRPQEKKS